MQQVKLSSLDLDLLVALDAMLETGSVSGAALRLHRSQPAVSRMLARLRDLFADPLFVPQGRGLVPTPRARMLHAPLKRLLGDVQQLVRPPEPFDPARARAHFRLISSDYAAVTLLGRVAGWLREVAPGVTLEQLPVDRHAVQALAAGEADLLLGPAPLCPPWCDHEVLLADDWRCARRRGERLPRTLAQYLALDHVEVAMETAFGRPVQSAIERATPGAGASVRRVTLTVPDFAGALFVVAASPLVATVPAPVARAAAAVLPLAVGRVPFAPAGPSIAMIWPRRLEREPAHAWLRRAVRERVAEPVGARRA